MKIHSTVQRLRHASFAFVMMYVHVSLALRQIEGLPYERGIDVSYETVRV